MSRRLQKEWKDLQLSQNSHAIFQKQYAAQYQQFLTDHPDINDPTQQPEHTVEASVSLANTIASIFPSHHIILFPTNLVTLQEWISYITGPEDTPYHTFRFELRLSLPHDYPHSAPKVAFVTPIFHPNIDFNTGEICLDILKTNWSPAWTLEATIRAVYLLLSQGETDSPLNLDAANIIRTGDSRGFFSMARMFCLDHAIPLKLDTMSPQTLETTTTTTDETQTRIHDNQPEICPDIDPPITENQEDLM